MLTYVLGEKNTFSNMRLFLWKSVQYFCQEIFYLSVLFFTRSFDCAWYAKQDDTPLTIFLLCTLHSLLSLLCTSKQIWWEFPSNLSILWQILPPTIWKIVNGDNKLVVSIYIRKSKDLNLLVSLPVVTLIRNAFQFWHCVANYFVLNLISKGQKWFEIALEGLVSPDPLRISWIIFT